VKIRMLAYEDFSEASNVLWKSFYFAEKNNHSMNGMELFRDLISPVSLSIHTLDGSVVLYGAFDSEKLVAVGALKNKSHILMLYVLPNYQKKGIGDRLLRELEKKCTVNKVTLNSSDFAISFYQKRGYRVCGPRKVERDLISTPMEKNLMEKRNN